MPNGNAALATDKNIMWRVAKNAIELYAREFGVEIGNTRPFRWLSQEIRRIFKERKQELPKHWIQSVPGVLAAAGLQSPRFLAGLFSRVIGFDENKLHKLFNEGLDAGVLSVAITVEKNANRPDDAQDVSQETRRILDGIVARLKGSGLFKDLGEEGKKLFPVITQMSWSADENEQALALRFLEVYATANPHQRAVLQNIGQRPVWERREVHTILTRSISKGDIDLNTSIQLMTLHESQSRFNRVTSFIGAALTGDQSNPDFRRLREGVDLMNTRFSDDAVRRRRVADQLEAERHRKPPSWRERLNMLSRRWRKRLGT